MPFREDLNLVDHRYADNNHHFVINTKDGRTSYQPTNNLFTPPTQQAPNIIAPKKQMRFAPCSFNDYSIL